MLFGCFGLDLVGLLQLLLVLLAQSTILQLLLVDLRLHEHFTLSVLEALHLCKLRILLFKFFPLLIGDFDWINDDLVVVKIRERANIIGCLPLLPLLHASEDADVLLGGLRVVEHPYVSSARSDEQLVVAQLRRPYDLVDALVLWENGLRAEELSSQRVVAHQARVLTRSLSYRGACHGHPLVSAESYVLLATHVEEAGVFPGPNATRLGLAHQFRCLTSLRHPKVPELE